MSWMLDAGDGAIVSSPLDPSTTVSKKSFCLIAISSIQYPVSSIIGQREPRDDLRRLSFSAAAGQSVRGSVSRGFPW